MHEKLKVFGSPKSNTRLTPCFREDTNFMAPSKLQSSGMLIVTTDNHAEAAVDEHEFINMVNFKMERSSTTGGKQQLSIEMKEEPLSRANQEGFSG